MFLIREGAAREQIVITPAIVTTLFIVVTICCSQQGLIFQENQFLLGGPYPESKNK